MNKPEFTEMLKAHDWYYERSDDHYYYSKGKKERDNIRAAIRENPELKIIFDKYVEEHKINLF